jgi:hypothetical protein
VSNIETSVPLHVTPLINADAETFRAEYTWAGGLPAPSVALDSARADDYAVDITTLAATGSIQSYRFVNPEVESYALIRLSVGVVMTFTLADLWSRADFDAFFLSNVGFQAQNADPESMKVKAHSGSGVAIVYGWEASWYNDWDGQYFQRGTEMATVGPIVTLTVDTFKAPGNAVLTAYPFCHMLGWPDRIRGIGAMRVPALFHS